VLGSFGIEVRQAMNQLVLITTTSAAQPVAAGIDYEDWPEVVGTIAGDDTVLIVCPDERQARTLKYASKDILAELNGVLRSERQIRRFWLRRNDGSITGMTARTG